MKSNNFTTVTSLTKHPRFEIWNYDFDNDKPIDIPKGTIRICYFPEKNNNGISFIVSRRIARLLAKRINQHLDELIKRKI